VRSPGKNWLRAGVRPAVAAGAGRSAPAGRTVPGRATLRAATFAGGASALRIPAYRPGRAPRIPARGWLRPGGQAGARRAARLPGAVPRSGAEVLAARSAPSGLSAMAGGGTPLARRSPRAGWLRSGSPSWASSTGPRLAPRRGWIGGTSRPRTVIGSTPGGARRGNNWYTAGPSRDWVRHGRHPWRKRRQRLLRMVGVGR
jgi:hypothetical protein